MEEDVLIGVKLDATDMTQEVKNLTADVDSLTKSTQGLVKTNESLAKNGKSVSDQFVGNSRQIEVNKQKIDQNVSSRKNLVSILTTEKGKQSELGQALSKVAPQLTGAADSAVNLGGSLLKLATSKAGLALGAIGAVAAPLISFFTRTQAGADLLEDAISVLTTTVGVFLDRLAGVGAGIVDIFKGNPAAGIDKIASSFDGVGKEIAENVALTLELNAATRDLEDANIALAISAAVQQNQIKQLLLAARNRTISEQDRLKLLEQASDIEKSLNKDQIQTAEEAVRIATLQAAKRLNSFRQESIENEDLAKQKKELGLIALTSTDAEVKKAAYAALQKLSLSNQEKLESVKLAKEESETKIEFANRVLKAFTDNNAVQDDNLRDSLAKAIVAYEQYAGQSIDIQGKIENQRDAANDKIEAQAEKEKQDELELARFIKGVRDSSLDAQYERSVKEEADKDKRLAGLKSFTTAEVKVTTDADKAILNSQTALAKQGDEVTKESIEKRKKWISDFIKDIATAVHNGLQAISGILNVINQASAGEINNLLTHMQNNQKERLDSIQEQSDEQTQALEDKRDSDLSALDQQYKMQLVSDDEYSKQKQAIDDSYSTKKETLDKRTSRNSTALEKSTNAEILEVKKEAFEQNKKNQVAQALIAVFQSALQAYQSLIGTPFIGPIIAPIAAAAATVFGLKNVQNIKETEFSAAAGGGNFLTKGPTMLLVGDNPGGVERVTVEPLSGKGKTVVRGDNMVAMAGGGTLTAIGNETRVAAQMAESSFNARRLAQIVNGIQPILVLDDVETKVAIKAGINNRAKVI